MTMNRDTTLKACPSLRSDADKAVKGAAKAMAHSTAAGSANTTSHRCAAPNAAMIAR